MPTEHDDLRTEAVVICRDVIKWRATEAEWEHIATLVDVLANAVAAENWTAIGAATIELELASPFRIIRAGDKEPNGDKEHKEIPKNVRERVNITITELDKKQPPPDK